MHEIIFTKASEQHLKDCRDALCQSTIGERYFSSPGSAEIAILEGIRQENLYVAFIGEECVGFTYIPQWPHLKSRYLDGERWRK